MKIFKLKFPVALLLAAMVCAITLPGCGLMEASFKAGFLFALAIAAIIGLLIWILHITWKLLGKYFPNFRYYLEGFWDE